MKLALENISNGHTKAIRTNLQLVVLVYDRFFNISHQAGSRSMELQ